MSLPLPKHPKRTCAKKRRFPDEMTARASAMDTLKFNSSLAEMHVYRCTVCHGWHKTRFPVNAAVTKDNPLKERTFADEVLDLMLTGTITSYFGAFAQDEASQLIHTTCIQLEQDGLIEQIRHVDGGIVWRKMPILKRA